MRKKVHPPQQQRTGDAGLLLCRLQPQSKDVTTGSGPLDIVMKETRRVLTKWLWWAMARSGGEISRRPVASVKAKTCTGSCQRMLHHCYAARSPASALSPGRQSYQRVTDQSAGYHYPLWPIQSADHHRRRTRDADKYRSEDIESIDVLKDGPQPPSMVTRGTNGVILITTKKVNGETPPRWISIPTSPYRKITKEAGLLNARAVQTAGGPRAGQAPRDYGANTNWFDEVSQRPSRSITISASKAAPVTRTISPISITADLEGSCGNPTTRYSFQGWKSVTACSTGR